MQARRRHAHALHVRREKFFRQARRHVARDLGANGVVELTGVIHDERQRRALRVLAGNVDGVKRVRDALTRANPLTGSVIDEPPPGSTD